MVTLDLHANVSDAMVSLADAVVSYKTYPHTDMKQVGCKAAELLKQAMRFNDTADEDEEDYDEEGRDGSRTTSNEMSTLGSTHRNAQDITASGHRGRQILVESRSRSRSSS